MVFALFSLQLIEFMIHLVGGKKVPKTGLPLKRKLPLMISDTSTQQIASTKRAKFGKAFSIEEVPSTYVVNSVSNLHDLCDPCLILY